MNWLRDLRVANKLALSFGACLLLALGGGVVGLYKMAMINAIASVDENRPVLGLSAISRLLVDESEYRTHIFEVASTLDQPTRDRLLGQLAANKSDVASDLNEYSKALVDDQGRAQLSGDWDAIVANESKIVGAVGANGATVTTKSLLSDFNHAFDIASSHAQQVADWDVKQHAGLAAQATATYIASRNLIVVILACALLSGIALASVVTRSIAGALALLVKQITNVDIGMTGLKDNAIAVAAGDFHQRHIQITPLLEWDRHDEIGQVACTFDSLHRKLKTMVRAVWDAQASLSNLIRDVRDMSESVAQTSGELASSSENLASRTSTQAANLEETSASMEEITSIVKQSADNARHANDLALKARDVAQNGGEVVHRAVESMGGINEAIKHIANIVTVIDEIAFQTNLLALNAAVEAARVGEQGRGFAVVASEVRMLAGRSSTAAKEIKSLVTDSVTKVNDGTELVNMSGHNLEQIVGAVEEVAAIIENISTAAAEQSAGIDQVNRAIIALDDLTQQNAALVQSASTDSQAVSSQAVRLINQLHKFKLQDPNAENEAAHVSATYGNDLPKAA